MIEKIQERALRFIFDDYKSTYQHLLKISGLPSLEVRRMRQTALQVFKIIHKEGPVYLHNFINFKSSPYNFRYSNTASLPRPRTVRYGKRSFRYAGAKLWNTLPDQFRNCSSFNQFQALISKWEDPVCICPSCS